MKKKIVIIIIIFGKSHRLYNIEDERGEIKWKTRASITLVVKPADLYRVVESQDRVDYTTDINLHFVTLYYSSIKSNKVHKLFVSFQKMKRFFFIIYNFY